jgi:GNAT superfamily N-acetyltransferase
LFADIALSRRLERAEAYACVKFAEARRRLFPESGAEWIECAGAYAIFDGVTSPVTQTFCLGLFEPLTAAALDVIEDFFQRRGAPVFHEVSPLAGVGAFDLLCARGYRPVEISSVLYRPVPAAELPGAGQESSGIRVRRIRPDEAALWNAISAKAWSHEHPEFRDFLLESGSIAAAREGADCFLAESGGEPGAAAALSIHNGVALLAGSATIPEMRRRGFHGALLQQRMRHAAGQGCDVAMMVAQAGSESQRNAERRGFRVAYTRTKWRLRR